MIGASLVLLPLLVLGIWLFVRLKPNTSRQAELRRFNTLAISIVVISVSTVSYLTVKDMNTSTHPDRGWAPVLAVFMSVLLTAVELVILSLLRMAMFHRKAP